ncbi:cytochrome c-type biogenesis protein CcmH [Paracoccus seriniphilus]|uniref:Cytochrome c-type biogenesis protein CcmH n=2 Tax=Paracoccus seriniphilus TaxID=184748 RepID=A0A239PMT5_9RHOB|nr:cytochrome c-type biogenesis protein CcmH [Paracoccus seriniphilus]
MIAFVPCRPRVAHDKAVNSPRTRANPPGCGKAPLSERREADYRWGNWRNAMFWIICLALLVIVAVAILAPVWRQRGNADATVPAASFDMQVYRDQMREVERDLERGVIQQDDAERLRVEIGRKILDADRRMTTAPAIRRGGAAIAAMLAIAVFFGGAVALYMREGAPGMPDLPIGKRIAMAQSAYEDRPDQTTAEAEAPARPQQPQADAEYLALVERLREAVAKNPEDPQGLTLLANSEMRLGNIIAAREAQQRLVALRGNEASAQELMQLAALMMEAAGGLITPEGEEVLARALQKNPRQPQSRYLLGLLQLQNGRPDRAFPIWRELLEQGPDDAPWIAPIRNSILDLAWLAGHPDYVPPRAASAMPALPGPDQDSVAAAQDMTPAERQEMIQGMVSQLETRLAEEGGTPEEWARLISSLVILGQQDHARDIWGEAQLRFAASAEALAPIRAAAQNAGLIE